jgi:hypothetical protein
MVDRDSQRFDKLESHLAHLDRCTLAPPLPVRPDSGSRLSRSMLVRVQPWQPICGSQISNSRFEIHLGRQAVIVDVRKRPKAPSAEHEAVFRWILAGVDGLGERAVRRKVNGEDRVTTYAPAGELPEIIGAFEKAKKASSKAEMVDLINDFDLPPEAIPTRWLNELGIWDALLQRMPLTAWVCSHAA